jgi:hypothetical protein
MADMIRLSATELVDRFADTCAGAHFSNSKSLGKTTMAYGIVSNINVCKQLSARMTALRHKNLLFNTQAGSSTESIMLQGLWSTESKRASERMGSHLLSHLYVTTRGSMVDSISTICVVRGVFIKTSAYLLMESGLIMDIVGKGTRFGNTPAPGTLSGVLARDRSADRVRTSPTFKTLFLEAGVIRSAAMATAALDCMAQYSIVRRGFDDSGARFRDNASRKLAGESYERSVFNLLFVVKL